MIALRFSPRDRLFSNAEAAKDAIEDVVGIDGADDLAQSIERAADFGGDKLLAAPTDDNLTRARKRFRRQMQAASAASRSCRHDLAIGWARREQRTTQRLSDFDQP